MWEPNIYERSDGIDTLNWLADQTWVESIGYFGSSYLALTGWACIDEIPEKVKGMYLSMYGTNRYVSAYNDGLFRQDILTSWSMDNAGSSVNADYMESCRYMPQIDVDKVLWGVDLPWYRDMVSNTDYKDTYWQTGFWHILRDIPSKVKIPIVIEEGWYDHHLGSALSGYRSMPDEGLGKCLLRIDPWNHYKECVLKGHKCENASCNQVTDIYKFFETLLIKNEMPVSGVSFYVIGEDRWFDGKEWPAPKDIMKLYLDAEKRVINNRISDIDSKCSFLYYPEKPVLSHGAESCFKTMSAVGSLKQPEPGFRDDVLSFVSKVFSEDIHILGRINADIYVSSDAEDTAFSIKIMEIFSSGETYNIRSGITTLAYRGHSEERQEYVPGDIVKINIETWDISWTVKKGSRIRVDISSSDFPQYNVHSNYPGVWALQNKCKIAQQTIYSGISYPSVLNIPIWSEWNFGNEEIQ